MLQSIKDRIQESIDTKRKFLENEQEIKNVEAIAKLIVKCYQNGGKVLVAGNGGSASDSQHFVAELVGRFLKERRALPAIALTANSSNLTCISNDYSYDDVFSRQVEALGNPGDVFVGITTSGNSKNIAKAMELAKAQGLLTIGFLGKNGGVCKDLSDEYICPQGPTARVQEVHILVIHILCELIENNLFGE